MKILLDSDSFVSLRFADQSTHQLAKKILIRLKKEAAELFCLNLCLYETTTVISKKYSQKNTIDFYHEFLADPPCVIAIDDTLEKIAWQIFLSQTKKGTSFIDCANLAAFNLYHFDKIFSFDTFYPQSIRLS